MLSDAELQSRHHVNVERYLKKIDIEIEAMRALVDTYVIPAVTSYLSDTAMAAANMAKISGLEKNPAETTVKKATELFRELNEKRASFESAFLAAQNLGDEARAKAMAEKVLPAMLGLREVCDKLEASVGNGYWPLPKYREMLFCY